MSGGFGDTSLFSNSSKCSSHLFRCCSFPGICLPALSCTGLSGLLYFADRFSVESYRALMFPSLAACSASSANPSMYLLLCVRILLLSHLLVLDYSSGVLDFWALVLMELRAFCLSSPIPWAPFVTVFDNIRATPWVCMRASSSSKTSLHFSPFCMSGLSPCVSRS